MLLISSTGFSSLGEKDVKIQTLYRKLCGIRDRRDYFKSDPAFDVAHNHPADAEQLLFWIERLIEYCRSVWLSSGGYGDVGCRFSAFL